MKVLVTGANGFLASNIVRELNRRGLPVRAMVRPSADLTALKDAKYELFKGNIVNMIDVNEAVKDCDVVIHAAADTSQHYRSYLPLMKTNFLATVNLLEASRKNKVRRFIFVSTANTLGHGTKSEPGNETNPARYPFSDSAYGISKSKAQVLVQEYGLTGILSTVVVNPTFMIGPYDTKPASGKILLMMCGKKVVLLPPGGKNFIHVFDAAAAICNAIEKGKSGSCYLLANENLSFKEFFQKVQSATSGYSRKILLPGWILNILGLGGSLLSIAGIRTNLNYTNARILCTENYYSGTKAADELQMPQTPVDIAIADALEWFTRNGYIKKKVIGDW